MDRRDIELGTEPVEVETRPRAGVVVSARLTGAEAEWLFAFARQHNKRVAQVAREAILAFLRNGGEPSTRNSGWTGTVGSGAGLNLSFREPQTRTSGSVRQAEDIHRE